MASRLNVIFLPFGFKVESAEIDGRKGVSLEARTERPGECFPDVAWCRAAGCHAEIGWVLSCLAGARISSSADIEDAGSETVFNGVEG